MHTKGATFEGHFPMGLGKREEAVCRTISISRIRADTVVACNLTVNFTITGNLG
jgi:hypothetical protein